MERLALHLDAENKQAELIFEKRGYKEDTQITAHFNTIRDSGSYAVEAHRMQQRITGCAFHAKRENVPGLQCADLCAYPLARSLVLKGEPSIAASIVTAKILSGKQKGLVIFP